jgi:elongation factor Ts
VVEKEKEIYLEQARNEGKPERIAERIVTGRLDKFFQDVCLMEQAFVKDPDKTIGDLVTEQTAKIGEKITIRRFACFRLGVD